MDRERLLSDLRGPSGEGERTKAYKDSREFWTAGVGHYLDQSKDWEGVEFDQAQVDQWLEEDVAKALAAAQTLDEWSALDTDARQNAVVELVFNMGEHKWRSFKKSRAAMARRDWPTAKAELLNSDWAKQVQASRVARLVEYVYSGRFT